jgi:hypothetical protein
MKALFTGSTALRIGVSLGFSRVNDIVSPHCFFLV